MPTPPPQRYDLPLLIAGVIRAKSETRTPVDWRRFADRIEADGGSECLVETIRQQAESWAPVQWRRFADRIEYEEGRGGHPWTREELGLTVGTESTESTRAGADGAADHRQRPASINSTLPTVVG